MKNTSLIVLMIAVVLFVNANLAYSQNFQADLSKIDNRKFEKLFRGNFCGKSKQSQSCNTRWRNFSDLLNQIKQDTKVKDIQIAAFMMTTAYVETDIKNFSSETEEIEGDKNKDKDYWKSDSETGKTYFGRGWIQLTRKSMYEKAKDELQVDFVNKPDLAFKPEYAYKIMYLALMNGWLETYRTNDSAEGPGEPIKLMEFFKDGILDYKQARAIINANCVVGCRKNVPGQRKLKWLPESMFEFMPGKFLPKAEHLDAQDRMAKYPVFVKMIRESLAQ